MTNVETKDSIRREVASSTNAAGESASLTGPVSRGIRLKISRERPRTSGIVELASRRCLVGSAPSCHVRVDEPGVAPIECLIIQGSKNNVVRWLTASQQFAGGEMFEDEVLYAGDSLQIGPVELELLVDEIMSAAEPPGTEDLPEAGEDRVTEYVLRLERLEAQLVELQRVSELTISSSDEFGLTNSNINDQVAATIGDLTTQLAGLQTRSERDRDLWVGEKADLETLLQSRLREFDCLQDEVQCLREELVTVRCEFGNIAAHEVAHERLAEVAKELAERTQDFEQQKTSWERDRSEFQRQLRQNMERIEQFERQLAQQSERQSQSDATREAAEARAERLQESVDELSKRLAEQQEEYETVRAAWGADRTSLESQLAQTKQQLAQSAEAEAGTLELRETWDRQRAELKCQVTEAVSRADEIQEELEAHRRQSQQQQQGGCKSHADEFATDLACKADAQHLEREICVASNNPIDRLLVESSSIDDDRYECEQQWGDFLAPKPEVDDDAESETPEDSASDGEYGGTADVASNYCEQMSSDLLSAAHLDDLAADDGMFEKPLLADAENGDFGDPFEPAEPATERAAEAAFEVASSDPPVSPLDVLNRLGQSGVSSEAERVDQHSISAPITDTTSPNDRLSQIAASEVAVPPCERQQCDPPAESIFAPSTAGTASDLDDEEESIEAYMARLMNRVRGADDQDEWSHRVEPTVERTPVTEYTEVTKAPRPDREAEADEPDQKEYKPRSQAPEMADRMTAMRSLANDSARTAIASHAMRNWSSVMKLKLLVTVFALVSVFASIIFFWGNPLLMVLGSLLGVGVLGYWACNAIAFRKLWLDSLILEPASSDDDDSPREEDAAPA